jgi:hypothetical protein
VCHCHVGLVRQDRPTPHMDSNKTGRHSQVTRELQELVRIRPGVVGIQFLVTICISELPLILSNQNPQENHITIAERRPVASIEEAPDLHHRRSPILPEFVRRSIQEEAGDTRKACRVIRGTGVPGPSLIAHRSSGFTCAPYHAVG